MNILLICMIPLAFIVGVFSCLKSVQVGLKWKMQVEQKIEPTLSNPIVNVVENMQADKLKKQIEVANKEQQRINDEWMFGKE